MNILLVHNYYLTPGGEDVAFQNEFDILRRHGHNVQTLEETNSHIAELNPFSVAFGTIWSEKSRLRFLAVLDEQKTDIVHFQNTFPLISPSAYYACHEAGVSVVQTLQNYRLLCPVATLYRNGHVCEECIGKIITWPGIVHACYHSSFSQSSVLAAMLAIHRAIGTWNNQVDAYIALTKFARDKFVAGGLPSHKIFIKPNFTSFDIEPKHGIGDYALFVGRLSGEKGIRTLLAAWQSLSIPLKIAGDGPLRDDLLRELNTSKNKTVEYLGGVPHTEILNLMKKACFLIFPSEWYEGFPLTIAEAFACSLPIITTNIGSQAEIVVNGYSGLHFRVGDVADLTEKVRWCSQNPHEVLLMGRNARQEYEESYSPEKNYQQLMSIYSRVLEHPM